MINDGKWYSCWAPDINSLDWIWLPIFKACILYYLLLPRDAMLAPYSLSLYVSLSVTSQNDWRIELVFLSTYPALCCKEILVSPKLGYFPLKLCPTLRTYKISPRQVDRVINKTHRSSSTVELVDDTYATVDESWLFTTSPTTVAV